MTAASFIIPDQPIRVMWEAQHPLIRIHWAGRSPLFWGPRKGQAPGGRYDAPDGAYRALYTAAELAGAVAETLLRDPARRFINRDQIAPRAWSVLLPRRPLDLVDLTGPGLARFALDAHALTTMDYGETRALAQAIFDAYPAVDGIASMGRVNNRVVNVTLFDKRAKGVVRRGATHLLAETRAAAAVHEIIAAHDVRIIG